MENNININSIKVSVITPVYNDGKYIKETINSILKQTHQNFEIIIVDDASTDNTLEIVESFRDKRIKVFKNDENRGAAYSRNRAIKESSGEYIAFLDGDDLWLPNKLEVQLDYMVNHGYGFTCTEYWIGNENGEKTKQYVTGPKKISHKTFLKTCYIGCLTVVYKRSLYHNLCIPDDIRKRNDYALWIKLSEHSPCYYVKEKLSIYRKRNNGSISSGKKSSLIKHHKDLFYKLYGFSNIKCMLYAYRNVLYYFFRKVFFVKKATD